MKIKKKKKEIKEEKAATIFLFLVLAFAVLVLFFTAKSMFFPSEKIDKQIQQPEMQSSTSRMSLTSFDKELARQMMDKNNDGRCDACGMPIEMCIDTGMMQCSGMDPDATIGLLGSQHIHSDFKVYMTDKSINFANENYYMKSSFIHVDDNQNKEDASGILHMHATGVPLWIFFESIELKLPDGMKVYVNGNEIQDYKNYVFNDLDKILINDGVGDLQEQLNSITNFSKNH